MWFLIGSRAIQAITNDFYRNTDKSDMDLYCSLADFKNFIKSSVLLEQCFPLKKNKYRIKIKGQPIIELKIYSENSVYHWLAQKEQQELLSNTKYQLENIEVYIPNLMCLKSIKQSHLYWPIHWVKNIEDFTWLKNKTDYLPKKSKDYEFNKKIKKEMQSLHGKIHYGHLSKIPDNYNELIRTQCRPTEYEKKVVYFIYEKLSLKQKIKVINNWNNFRYLLENHDHDSKKNPIIKNKY